MMQVLQRVEAALGAEAVLGFGIDVAGADRDVLLDLNHIMHLQIRSLRMPWTEDMYGGYAKEGLIDRFTEMHAWAQAMEHHPLVTRLVAKNTEFFKWFYIFSVYCAMPPEYMPPREMFGYLSRPPVLKFEKDPLWSFLYAVVEPKPGTIEEFLNAMKNTFPEFLANYTLRIADEFKIDLSFGGSDRLVVARLTALLNEKLKELGSCVQGSVSYLDKYKKEDVLSRFTDIHEWAKSMKRNSDVDLLAAKDAEFFKWFYIYAVYRAMPPDCPPPDEMFFGSRGSAPGEAKDGVLLFPYDPLWKFLYLPGAMIGQGLYNFMFENIEYRYTAIHECEQVLKEALDFLNTKTNKLQSISTTGTYDSNIEKKRVKYLNTKVIGFFAKKGMGRILDICECFYIYAVCCVNPEGFSRPVAWFRPSQSTFQGLAGGETPPLLHYTGSYLWYYIAYLRPKPGSLTEFLNQSCSIDFKDWKKSYFQS